jgi:hypothetical protein
MPGSRCGSRSPTRAPWSSSRPSSGPPRARRWTSSWHADKLGLVVRGHQLPRRQPDDQFRELRPGARSDRQRLQGGPRPRLLQDEPGRHRRRISRALRPREALPRAGQGDQHRNRPGCFRRTSRSWPSRAASSWRFRRLCGLQGDRQGRARRQAVLLHQRRRLPHLLRRHLRPLQIPRRAFKTGPDPDQLGFRADLRRARRRLDGREPARARSATISSTARTSAPTATPRHTYFNGFPSPRRWCT